MASPLGQCRSAARRLRGKKRLRRAAQQFLLLRKRDRVVMPFGVMGGAYQPTGHARLISNIVDFGLDPQAAIDGPRSFSGDEGMQVERGYAPEVRAKLAAMGHDVCMPDGPLGGAQAIVIDESGVLQGASDPRKDGCALGY